MKLRWAPLARTQLLEHLAYIAEDDLLAAVRVRDRIVEAGGKLTGFPSIGRPGSEPNTRELTVHGTPYVLIYSADDEAKVVSILAVWHWPSEPRLRLGPERTPGPPVGAARGSSVAVDAAA